MRITSALNTGRKYDLVVFGASGFTGKHVVQYLTERLPSNPNLKWAMAGRDVTKIKQVNHEWISRLKNVDVIQADVKDVASLKRMSSESQIVLNCVGPYSVYGESVVKSCIDTSTHYLDVSGEPYFLESIQSKYHEDAIRNSCFVIGACGFDSIPADMAVDMVCKNYKDQIDSIETYLQTKTKKGNIRINYATWESLVNGYKNYLRLKQVRNQLFNHDLLTTDPRAVNFFKHDSRKRKGIHYLNGFYVVPFVGSDRSVIKRSQFAKFLYSSQHDLDDYVQNNHLIPVQTYYEFPSLVEFMKAVWVGLWINTINKTDFGTRLLLKYAHIFSAGISSKNVEPSKEFLAGCSFEMRVVANLKMKNGKTGNKTLMVTGPDPGYRSAAICLIESAFCLLNHDGKIPDGITGGVYTPSFILSQTELVRNLNLNGMRFYLNDI